MVASDAAVAGREEHSGDAFEDVEVVEQIGILLEEGVGWVRGEVEGAAAQCKQELCSGALILCTLCS